MARLTLCILCAPASSSLGDTSLVPALGPFDSFLYLAAACLLFGLGRRECCFPQAYSTWARVGSPVRAAALPFSAFLFRALPYTHVAPCRADAIFLHRRQLTPLSHASPANSAEGYSRAQGYQNAPAEHHGSIRSNPRCRNYIQIKRYSIPSRRGGGYASVRIVTEENEDDVG
ncbi:hypothetical protein BV25DRAFT_365034 [Artomyces pyxidatus]|uniref:Uncharacterized protein n=1 Tax=Artomyces pyxidatus TaxID=48021 RepID=A0ACB8T4Y6_9AGAM|nr:hypothetical protein BV25DRAFT_365034 [Artomyces pyxidatus]